MFHRDRRRSVRVSTGTEPRPIAGGARAHRGAASLFSVTRWGTLASVAVLVALLAAAPAATSRTMRPLAAIESSSRTAPAYLQAGSVDSAFRAYMDGLTFHDMATFRAATCPRLRNTLKGFELHGYYVGAWRSVPYEYDTASSSATVAAVVSQEDPSTGAWAGDVTYSWNVEQDADGSYYVCGWLG